MSDLEKRFHEEWLGMVQPEGLVVSVPVLTDAQVMRRLEPAFQQKLLACCPPASAPEARPRRSTARFATPPSEGRTTADTTFTTESAPTALTSLQDPANYLDTILETPWETFDPVEPTACCVCSCGNEDSRVGGIGVEGTTGTPLVSQRDVGIKARSPAFHITRTYRGVTQTGLGPGMLGRNWTCNWDRRFVPSGRDLTYVDVDGRAYLYKETAVAQVWSSSPGRYESVLILPAPYQGGTLLQRELKTGRRNYYARFGADPTYRLVRIEDSNEEAIVLQRDPLTGRLESLVDSIGRREEFFYHSSPAFKLNRLASVRDHSQRTWLYDYVADSVTGEAVLARIETPPAEWYDRDSNGTLVGPYFGPRVTEYSYRGDDASRLVSIGVRGLQNGQLQLAPASEKAVRFNYDARGSVNQLDYGSGTAFYNFDVESASPKATQIDRAGNVLRLDHVPNADGFQDIQKASLATRGLRPFDPDPAQGYEWRFVHDANHELTRIHKPRGNVEIMLRDSRGNVIEHTLQDRELSPTLVAKSRMGYEPTFNMIKFYVEPRGNDPSLTPEQRDAFATHFFYDHERLRGSGGAIEQAHVALGLTPGTWDLQRDSLKSYGRTLRDASGDFVDPFGGGPGSVFADKDGDGVLDRGGNLYVLRGPRPRIINQLTPTRWDFDPTARQALETSMAYNRYGQAYLEVNPDNRRTRHQFDVGAFDLATNPDAGYLERTEIATRYVDENLDPNTGLPLPLPAGAPTGAGLDLATTFQHDARGNLRVATDPEGHTSSRVVDALSLVTEEIGPSPMSYRSRHLYDARGNRLRDEIENKVPLDDDRDGLADRHVAVAARPFFQHDYRYNTVNMLVRIERDAFGTTAPHGHVAVDRLVTVLERDEKQRIVLLRQPEGNVHSTAYDERDLVLETISGASDDATAQRTRFKHDENGNLAKIFDDDGNDVPALILGWDGIDRLVKETDELGEVTDYVRDLAGHVGETKRTGRLRGLPDLPATVLARAYARIDEASRTFVTSADLFKPTDGTAINAGPLVAPGELLPGTQSRLLRLHTPDGRVEKLVDDNAHVSTFGFDLANRETTVTDHLGSTVERVLDKDSFVVRVRELEVATDGSPARTFYSERFHDEEHRLVMTVSQLGNTTRFMHDSRGNVVERSDAMASPSGATLGSLRPGAPAVTAGVVLNRRGNTVRFVYDGMSRLLETLRDLREDATGDTDARRVIRTKNFFDGNNRLIEQHDSNDNATHYCYDHQNRLVRTEYANGTRRELTWVENDPSKPRNRTSTVKVDVDGRNVARKFSYDEKERRIRLDVTGLPPGVGQTTFATWRWDGLDRMTEGRDDDTVVTQEFDSLGRRIGQEQEVATAIGTALRSRTDCAYDGVGNRTQVLYPRVLPSGASGLTLTLTFDEVNRLSSIQDGGASPVVAYHHAGLGGRRLSRHLSNQTESVLEHDDDRRVISLQHGPTGNPAAAFKRFEYVWDRAENRRSEREAVRNLGSFYEYDSAYRLIADQRDVVGGALPGYTSPGSVNQPRLSTPAGGVRTEYELDGANNRRSVVEGGAVSTYFQESRQTWSPSPGQPLPPKGSLLSDAAMNQHTSVTRSGVTKHFSYDLAGNQISGGEQGEQRFFDCEDRLIQITNANAGTDVRYRYDVLGRRLSKTIHDLATGVVRDEIVFARDGWETLEEWTSTGTLRKRFVYGARIDEPVRVDVPETAANLDDDVTTSVGARVQLWFHENSIGSVVALTNKFGAVVESYRYKAYGELAEILDKSGAPVGETQTGNPFYFQGRRRDFEEATAPSSALMYYRNRYYDAGQGRFISRDPRGVWTDLGQLGNAQAAFANNPINHLDPFGLDILGEDALISGLDANGDPIPVTKDVVEQTGAYYTERAEGNAVSRQRFDRPHGEKQQGQLRDRLTEIADNADLDADIRNRAREIRDSIPDPKDTTKTGKKAWQDWQKAAADSFEAEYGKINPIRKDGIKQVQDIIDKRRGNLTGKNWKDYWKKMSKRLGIAALVFSLFMGEALGCVDAVTSGGAVGRLYKLGAKGDLRGLQGQLNRTDIEDQVMAELAQAGCKGAGVVAKDFIRGLKERVDKAVKREKELEEAEKKSKK